VKRKKIKSKIEKKFNSLSDELKMLPTKSPRDHDMYNLYYKGKMICTFQISRSSREFGKKLVSLMARQLGISSRQLVGIEKCTFWAKDFVRESRLTS